MAGAYRSDSLVKDLKAEDLRFYKSAFSFEAYDTIVKNHELRKKLKSFVSAQCENSLQADTSVMSDTKVQQPSERA